MGRLPRFLYFVKKNAQSGGELFGHVGQWLGRDIKSARDGVCARHGVAGSCGHVNTVDNRFVNVVC